MAALDWTTARTNLTAWAEADYGLGALPVAWRHTAQDSSYFGRGRIVLDLVSPVTVGYDEVLYTDAAVPASGAELDVVVRGHRTITLDLQIEVQDQRAGLDAIAYAERLGASFRLPSVRSLFSESGLAFQRVLNTTDLVGGRQGSVKYQQRIHSMIQMDVLLNMAVELADTAETYIETMRYETELLGADGNPVAHQLSGDMDLIP